jgi:hypothetical protein
MGHDFRVCTSGIQVRKMDYVQWATAVQNICTKELMFRLSRVNFLFLTILIFSPHRINHMLFSYFFLDEKVSKKSRLQMMKGAHLQSAECLR